MNNRKNIFLIAGDPNSINSEIIYKSWKKLNKKLRKRLYIIGSYDLIKKQFIKLRYKIIIEKIVSLNQLVNTDNFKIINIDLKFNHPFNVAKKESSDYILKCLNLGHILALKKNTLGLINCAISKNLFKRKKTGVTEYLANKCKIKDKSEVMLIKNNNFSVCPLTTHIDLKDVSRSITSKIIVIKIKTILKNFYKIYKKKPRIGVMGLNPHNAELRPDSEEVKQIIPAIKKLKAQGCKIEGPIVSDTAFINKYKKFDIIVGMYHDQVLSPFKSIFKYNAINLTLGLKYLRASPDHGVAIDIIKKNKANALSLMECIKFVNKFG